MIDKNLIKFLLKNYEEILRFKKTFYEPYNIEDAIYQRFIFGEICTYELVINDLRELLKTEEEK